MCLLSCGILPATTDYDTPRLNFQNNFRTILPHREDWKSHSPLCDVDIDIFVVGLKIDSGEEAGIFDICSHSIYIALSISLFVFGSILQAEVLMKYTGIDLVLKRIAMRI